MPTLWSLYRLLSARAVLSYQPLRPCALNSWHTGRLFFLRLARTHLVPGGQEQKNQEPGKNNTFLWPSATCVSKITRCEFVSLDCGLRSKDTKTFKHKTHQKLSPQSREATTCASRACSLLTASGKDHEDCQHRL